MVPGMGPVRLKNLLEVFETPVRVLTAGKAALESVKGIGRDTANSLAEWEATVDLAAELKRIEAFGFPEPFFKLLGLDIDCPQPARAIEYDRP